MGEKNLLRNACEYALTCGGKRLRPSIVFMIADALGHGVDVSSAAISVECFHTASLIADDLPCMDNDDLRRNRASLHREFEEGVALLASYTLIAEGYGGICRNGSAMKKLSQFAQRGDSVTLLCLQEATRCAGMQGATNGQFLDLYPSDLSWETVRKTIYQKTVTLFEISFLFGWLFGGGDVAVLDALRDCAYHLGMAFQIADDLDDDVQDAEHTGGVNAASVLGRKEAISLLKKEIASFQTTLESLKLWTAPFQNLHTLLAGRCGGFC
ncbi:MAG: polyprenyl synthetase family protein [Chlamydiia bacterium]|nr:polyprenyl synthetase family protein [Chlamydiia bacterium]